MNALVYATVEAMRIFCQNVWGEALKDIVVPWTVAAETADTAEEVLHSL